MGRRCVATGPCIVEMREGLSGGFELTILALAFKFHVVAVGVGAG